MPKIISLAQRGDAENVVLGTNEPLMELIRTCFENRKPMGQALHRKAMDLFRQYLIVGGMEVKDGITYLPLYMTPRL